MTEPRKSIPAFCLLLLVFCGCAAAPKMTARMDFASPEAALEHIAAQAPANIALQAMADIRVTVRDEGHPLKLAVLLKTPASLRVEAIPLFGTPAFFLSVHNRTLKVFLAETRTFYIGRATPDNMARYLPLKMGPEDLMAVLTGTCFAPAGPDTLLQGRLDGDYYRLDLVEPLKRRSLWVRTTDGFLERLDVYGGQQRLYRVRFEEPLRVEETVLPQKITFVSEGIDGLSMSIRYADIQFLKDIDPETFDLKTPPGVEPVYLD
ncbi:MAG: DUF4292 domain-containing protein [Pseudomonadota bacterium]